MEFPPKQILLGVGRVGGIIGRENARSYSMKRYALTIAAVIGGFIGFYWVSVAGAMSEGFRMGPVWFWVLYITCPMIDVVRIQWWLVPVLNAGLYAMVAFAIPRVRRAISN
jgi:hypothetical protein